MKGNLMINKTMRIALLATFVGLSSLSLQAVSCPKLAKQQEEKKRIEDEKKRVQKEEEKRVQDEQKRVQDEQKRIQLEQKRIQDEQKRIQDEQKRIQDEQERLEKIAREEAEAHAAKIGHIRTDLIQS